MAKILLIEDDPYSADIVIRVLKRTEHEVIHTAEGLTGLRICSEETIDLVLLDLGLPDVGGHTVAALINRLPGKVPIVAVTGSTDYATQRRAMTYGCDGYITKPINTRTFAEQIEKFIGGDSTGAMEGQEDSEDAGEENKKDDDFGEEHVSLTE